MRWGRAGGLTLLAAAVLAAWLATSGLALPARFLTVFLVTVLPAVMLLQGRMAHDLDPASLPRYGLYLSSSLALWTLAALTLASALASGFSLASLGLRWIPVLPLLGWTAGGLLAGIGLLTAWRVLGVRETPLVEHLMPRSPAEKRAFVGVALSAGIAEELVFRGFLIPALTVMTGGVWTAVLLGSAVFGCLHTYQGVTGVVRTACLGLLLTLPLVVSGSVLPAMIAHFLLDLIVGLWLADWLLRRT